MNFKNLDEYYDFLENDNDFSYLDLNKYITILRDKIENEDIRKLCSYELFFTDFSIEKGVHLPKFQSAEKVYPTLELFEDNFDYIKARAKSVNNAKYKAKYNHLLWLSFKHLDYAKQAIESYLILLQNSSFLVVDNLQCLSFANYYMNLFMLSQTINYKKDEVVKYFVKLLKDQKLNDLTNYSLMKFIIENGKKIDSSITQIFYDYSVKSIDKFDSMILEYYLNLLVILSQKLNLPTYEFHEKLGDYHISQLKTERDPVFIAHLYYANALKEYKKSNNKEKIEQAAVLLEKVKKNIDLKEFSFEFKDENLNNVLKQRWDFIEEEVSHLIIEENEKKIYGYLILKNILPAAETLNEEIKLPTHDFVSTITFDINKNINKNKSGGISAYFLYINNFSIKHIWLVISKGIKSGKISYESLIDFLKNNSWYGQDFTYSDINNKIQGFNWIDLISPSLHSFFIQSEIDIKTNKHNSQGYILAIDSFVLKFEGLLREFLRMIGAQTIEIKENGNEERINFDKLLSNEKLKAFIPEDDIAFFKFLFTSKGMNLRNNIAHCFFTTNKYSSSVMILMIVALLRLGNYKFGIK